MDRVIVLNATSGPGERPAFRYLLRLTVPRWAAKAVSGITTSEDPGADAEVIAALRRGDLVEAVREWVAPDGVTWQQIRDSATVRQTIQAALEAAWTAAQQALDDAAPWALFGVRWDGTRWGRS
jgi:hypothetical protein